MKKSPESTSICLSKDESEKFKQFKLGTGGTSEECMDLLLFAIKKANLEPATNVKKITLPIYISEETKKEFQELSREKNMSISELIETFFKQRSSSV